jgi:hypothetical protein
MRNMMNKEFWYWMESQSIDWSDEL